MSMIITPAGRTRRVPNDRAPVVVLAAALFPGRGRCTGPRAGARALGECKVRFESRLLFPDGEHPHTTYLQLGIEDLQLTWCCVDTFLPIAAVKRLRDQVTVHLDAAHSCPSAPYPASVVNSMP
jgi:hypothetical protein